MRRKGILITLLFLWIYLVGMGILLYPAINNYYTSKRMESSVESFHGTSPTESGTDSTEATQAAQETEPPTPKVKMTSRSSTVWQPPSSRGCCSASAGRRGMCLG